MIALGSPEEDLMTSQRQGDFLILRSNSKRTEAQLNRLGRTLTGQASWVVPSAQRSSKLGCHPG